MKDFTQKLQNSCFVRNKSKISSFKEICHVASNENKFKIVNNLFIDNDSNNNNSNNFILITLFIYFVFLVIVFNATAY